MGTPVCAEARAVARSPWPSASQRAMTPTGASISGVSKRVPNSSTDRSRCAAPRSTRGMSPHFSNAETLARWVCSDPAPPVT